MTITITYPALAIFLKAQVSQSVANKIINEVANFLADGESVTIVVEP